MADDNQPPDRSRGKAAQVDEGPEITHDLLLADGSTVESSGGIPTHVAIGDQAIPVLFARER